MHTKLLVLIKINKFKVTIINSLVKKYLKYFLIIILKNEFYKYLKVFWIQLEAVFIKD